MTSSTIYYVLDTNVLIHDPSAIWNFDEHHLIITMTVLEELDKLKSGRGALAADARHAIRELDRILADAPPEAVERGVLINRGKNLPGLGYLSVLMTDAPHIREILPLHLNDNKILNAVAELKHSKSPANRVVLVSKDINMRLKARACGIDAEDYHTDQLVTDINQLQGLHRIPRQFLGWHSVSRNRADACRRNLSPFAP